MELMLFALLMVAACGIFLVSLFIKYTSSGVRSRQSSDQIKYSKKPIMTQAEQDFFMKLCLLERVGITVLPQVSLASVIQKDTPSRYRTELFRNIDFGIFDANYNLLALVELNDATHTRGDRDRRDRKVRRIARSAGIPLVIFYTNKPNEPTYVVSRIKKEIGLVNE